jgi:hypothetical protein|tara:strand:- start:19520 stop:19690 length:171 start_codon:yes stop_codon:yes gene_type:complete
LRPFANAFGDAEVFVRGNDFIQATTRFENFSFILKNRILSMIFSGAHISEEKAIEA